MRLKTFSSPAAGGGAVISESATHAIVVTGAGKQGVDFLDGGLGAAKPELQHAAHRGGSSACSSSFSIGLAIKRLHDAALLLQPLHAAARPG